jgi:hypothetical protein
MSVLLIVGVVRCHRCRRGGVGELGAARPPSSSPGRRLHVTELDEVRERKKVPRE